MALGPSDHAGASWQLAVHHAADTFVQRDPRLAVPVHEHAPHAMERRQVRPADAARGELDEHATGLQRRLGRLYLLELSGSGDPVSPHAGENSSARADVLRGMSTVTAPLGSLLHDRLAGAAPTLTPGRCV